MDSLYHQKLTSFDKCTARKEEIVAVQLARARRLRECAIYFNRQEIGGML